MNRNLRTIGLLVLGAAAAGTLAALLVRRQIDRHRRDLFSPSSIRRLAALSHMSRESPSVDGAMVLRDFIAWEPRRTLRNRARNILDRMEGEMHAVDRSENGAGGGKRTNSPH